MAVSGAELKLLITAEDRVSAGMRAVQASLQKAQTYARQAQAAQAAYNTTAAKAASAAADAATAQVRAEQARAKAVGGTAEQIAKAAQLAAKAEVAQAQAIQAKVAAEAVAIAKDKAVEQASRAATRAEEMQTAATQKLGVSLSSLGGSAIRGISSITAAFGRMSASVLGALPSIGSVGSALGRLGAVATAPIRGVEMLGSALGKVGSVAAIPINAASGLLRGLGSAATASLGVLRSGFGALGSVITAPIKGIGLLTSALGKIGLAAVGIRAVVGAAQGLGSLLGVGIASDVNEAWNKVQVVFGKNASAIDAFSKTAANSLGLSRLEALDTAGTFGNLFKTLGLSDKATLGMSQSVIKLAADLGSFNNLPTADVLEKIRSGLVGESEPLRSLGINLTEAAVAQEAVNLKLAKNTKNVSESAKVQARYSLILKQSKTAQNDFANTSSGMANATKRITAGLTNARIALGEKLLPVIAPVVAAFADSLPKALDKVTPYLETFGRIVTDIFRGNWSGVLDTIAEQIRLAFGQDALNTFRTVVADVSSILDSIKKGDYGAAIGKIWDGVKSIGTTLISTVSDAVSKADWPSIGASIQTGLGTAWNAVKNLAVDLWSKLFSPGTDAKGNATPPLFSQLTAKIGGWLQSAWDGVKAIGADIWSKLFDRPAEQIDASGTMRPAQQGLISKIGEWLRGAWDGVKALGANIWEKLFGSAPEQIDASGSMSTGTTGLVSQLFTLISNAVKGVRWSEVWKTVTGIGQGIIDSGLSIVNELTTWLASQIGQIDPKKLYANLPPPPKPEGKTDELGWPWNWLSAASTAISNFFQNIGQTIDGAARSIQNSTILSDAGKWLVDQIGTGISGALSGIAGENTTVGQNLRDSAGRLVDGLNAGIGTYNFVLGSTRFAGSFITGILDQIQTATASPENKDKVGTISETLRDETLVPLIDKESVQKFVDAGNAWTAGLVSGINDPTNQANAGLATQTLAGIVNGDLAKGLGVHSPSTITWGYGTGVVQGLINGMNGYQGIAASAAKSVGLAVTAGMWSGIISGRSMVITAAIGVARAAIDAAKRELGVRSPSKEFEAIGRQMAEGMALGLSKGSTAVLAATQGMAASAVGAPSYTPAPTVAWGAGPTYAAAAPASSRPPITVNVTGNTFLGSDRATAKRIAEILKPELDSLVRY